MRKRTQTPLVAENMTSPPQLLTIPQVAAALGVGKDKVYDLIYHQGLPSVSLGAGQRSKMRVSASSLTQWIVQLEQQQNPDLHSLQTNNQPYVKVTGRKPKATGVLSQQKIPLPGQRQSRSS